MSARKKKSKTARPVVPAESRPAEVVTVAWMLSLLVTILTQAIGIGIRLWIALSDASPQTRMLANLILLVAVVSGIATLVMTPLAIRLRETPAPRLIVIAAIIAGTMPLLACVVSLL